MSHLEMFLIFFMIISFCWMIKLQFNISRLKSGRIYNLYDGEYHERFNQVVGLNRDGSLEYVGLYSNRYIYSLTLEEAKRIKKIYPNIMIVNSMTREEVE